MAAATAQGTYINPMAALATQIPHALNGQYYRHPTQSQMVLNNLNMDFHSNRFAHV